ncbi:DUF6789 family protein [Nonomuraea sp. NPDC050536]|uniref:DUF6789 family protein n=1 Tax=Nonomuraea sp. NPDC050536 TaxID=3364366 RepID=UPI0037CB6B68
MKRELIAGAAGGALATVAMSAVMLAGQRAGLMADQPPKRVVRAMLPGHRHRPKSGEGVLGVMAHFGFGMASGALFGLVTRGGPVRVSVAQAYGLAIWAASYAGWVPWMGVLPPIHRDSVGRQAVMAFGHIVYGTTLAMALNRAARND